MLGGVGWGAEVAFQLRPPLVLPLIHGGRHGARRFQFLPCLEALGSWWLGRPESYSAPASFAASSEPSSPISIGSVDEFARNSSRILSLGGSKVIVARSQDGGFHSVSAVCTHLGCSIRYEERTDGPGFTCNCHSSRFGLQGENLGGMAPTPLKKYTVRVVAGEVWVSKGDGSSLP